MPTPALPPLPKNLSPLAILLHTGAPLAEVEAALASGDPGNAVNGLSGRLASPPLFYTLRRDDFPAMLALLRRHGADITLRDSKGRTALHRAVNVQASPEVIPQLIAAGIDPDLPDEAGASPLLAALRSGRPELARALIQAGASARARPDARTPLLANAISHAPASSIRAVLDLLLTAGADVQALAPGERTALLSVVGRSMDTLEDRLWVVRALLWNGADPNAVAANGDTPLGLASGATFPCETMECLVAAGADVHAQAGSALRAAAMRTTQRANAALAWLIARGASPLAANPETLATPLHLAAMFDASANVQTLLATPAVAGHLDARDSKGHTPLAVAFSTHAARAATLLLAAGADPLAPDLAGQPALFLLAEASRWHSGNDIKAWARFLDALVARGIDLDTPRPEDGQTLVHRLAACPGPLAPNLLHVVLEHGASPSRPDHAGRLPMDVRPTSMQGARPAREAAAILAAAMAAETAHRLAAPTSARPRRRA